MSTNDWYQQDHAQGYGMNAPQAYSYDAHGQQHQQPIQQTFQPQLPQQAYSTNAVDFTSYDYTSGQLAQPQHASFEAPAMDPAATYNYGNAYNPAQYSSPAPNVQYFNPADTSNMKFGQPDSSNLNTVEDEPPLLEELGINFDHIIQKTLIVLNPMKSAEMDVVQDTDLAGPLVFCLAFGGTLLLAGKLQFGHIYGLGVMGCLAMYCLLNLMSMSAVGVVCIMSILGYCLLPMCVLSTIGILLSLKGPVGVALTALSVLWCSVSASNLFVLALNMTSQRLLVAYPCSLVYCMFALLTVF